MLNTAEKHRRLIDELARRTFAGNADWKYGFSDTDYSTDLGKYQINISEVDGEYASDIIVKILDDGREIERFSDVNLTNFETTIPEFDGYYSLMQELYRRAGRAASGAEKVLDELLEELGLSE